MLSAKNEGVTLLLPSVLSDMSLKSLMGGHVL